MKKSGLLAVGLWTALLGGGCYLPEGGAFVDGGKTPSDGGVANSPDFGVVFAAGVPCDVQQLVAARCIGCHGTARPSYVPMGLVSLADFQAMAPSDSSMTVAAHSLHRMRDAARPMPPSGMLSETEIAALDAWVQAGLGPGQSCDNPNAGMNDGGASFDAGSSSSGDAGPDGDGLPCEVEAIVSQNCRGCHNGNVQTAPMPLSALAHFLAPAPSNGSQTVGAMSASRMQNAARPMPPGGQLASTQVAIIDSWVKAGMPAGSCQTPDAGPDPFAEPPRCSSETYWADGNSGSSRMNPGKACVSCHSARNANEGKEEAPGNVGGTVYPTAHEPDLCSSTSLVGAEVVLTGADGRVVTARVNSAGNFFLWNETVLARPYRAKVVYQGRERVMATPQMSGDCNSCHTQAGTNGAPGRILAP